MKLEQWIMIWKCTDFYSFFVSILIEYSNKRFIHMHTYVFACDFKTMHWCDNDFEMLKFLLFLLLCCHRPNFTTCSCRLASELSVNHVADVINLGS